MCQQNNDKRTLMFLIGGAGFIGKHIIEVFNHDEKIDIVVIDKEEQIEDLKKTELVNDRSKLISLDLNDSSLSKAIDERTGPQNGLINFENYKDVNIFHLASPVGVVNHNVSTFYDAMDINQNVFIFARWLIHETDANLRFWYTSSSELYGNIGNIGDNKMYTANIKLNTFYDINQKSGGFRSDYIYQKFLGEQLFKQLNDKYTVRILRLFNIIGKHQDPVKGVFGKFIRDIIDDNPVNVSKSIRCYTKVSILTDYIRRLLYTNSDYIQEHDIVTEEFKTSLTSEELYIYLHAYLNKQFMGDNPKTLNYKHNHLPDEIHIRGRKETMSYTQFRMEFSHTIDSIVSKICLPKRGVPPQSSQCNEDAE